MRTYIPKSIIVPALVAGVTLLGGCASEPVIDTSPDAELSFDGLSPIKGGRADAAWAREGLDLSQYSKIMLQGVGVEYRPGGESGYNAYRSSAGPFEVTEAQKQRFQQVVAEVFLEEMAKSERYTLVESSGPDVLLIRATLLDVVSYVPPEPSGRVDIYLSRVGEATLVIELRDSITEAILARAVDRRAAETMGNMRHSNRPANTAEVRRLVRAWGGALRNGLDKFSVPAE